MDILGPNDLRRMQLLSAHVTAINPALVNAESNVGELAWGWGLSQQHTGTRWLYKFWQIDDQDVGFGWITLSQDDSPARLIWQTHPGHSAVLAEVLTWFEQQTPGLARTIVLQAADTASMQIVTDHGFVLDAADASDAGYWARMNRRTLVDIPDPVLPDGYAFTSAATVSTAAALDVHQRAWESKATTLRDFDQVQATWPYQKDLHVMVMGPGGVLAATAIVWLDLVSKSAQFEPVGTDPEFRGKGLGKALQFHAMHLAKAAGAAQMLVACLGAPRKLPAQNLYKSVGFQPVTYDIPMMKLA